jgi:hypothetical protein
MQVHRGAHVGDLGDDHANDEGEQDGPKNCHENIVTHYLLVGRQYRKAVVRCRCAHRHRESSPVNP